MHQAKAINPLLWVRPNVRAKHIKPLRIAVVMGSSDRSGAEVGKLDAHAMMTFGQHHALNQMLELGCISRKAFRHGGVIFPENTVIISPAVIANHHAEMMVAS